MAKKVDTFQKGGHLPQKYYSKTVSAYRYNIVARAALWGAKQKSMQFKMRILFYPLKTKARKNGKCPLAVRLTINNQRAEFHSGITVLPAEFNGHVVKSTAANAAELNVIIQNISAKLNTIYLTQLTTAKTQPSPQHIKQLFLHKKVDTIGELVNITFELRKCNVKASTIRSITSRFNNLKAWLQAHKLIHILPSEWRHSYSLQYVQYLRSTGCEERAKKHYGDLKDVFQTAINQQIIDRSPIVHIKFAAGECKEPLHLSEQQLEMLQSIQLSNHQLSTAKDLLLFQCYTGLAYQDMMDFCQNMIGTHQGNNYIKYRRTKSEKVAIVPLLPQAAAILEKYHYRLPYMPNSKYNLYLKVIGDAILFNAPLTSHVGRKTCGMLLLNRGVPLQVVSAVLGHSSTRTTEMFYAQLKKDFIIPEVLKLR